MGLDGKQRRKLRALGHHLSVVVHDEALGETFEIDAPAGRALDVFHHPFAYAAFEGTEFATRVREPVGV